jgi:SAM-dependent methyltransferase
MDPTQRFSSRVEDYAQYRPGYPQEVIEALRVECGLTSEASIADIGSGTGLLSELFLRNGNPVFAVEPNREMRTAGEQFLSKYMEFRSIDGRAEATGLPDQSVDFIVSGQAFHWFDHGKARGEFKRILKPTGIVMIVWNERKTRSTPFLAAFELLLKHHVPDYEQLDFYRKYSTSVAEFFGTSGFRSKTFDYSQEISDFEGVQGRLLSSSYTPENGHPNYAPMLEDLWEIYEAHQVDGTVTFEYTTRMYYGRLP